MNTKHAKANSSDKILSVFILRKFFLQAKIPTTNKVHMNGEQIFAGGADESNLGKCVTISKSRPLSDFVVTGTAITAKLYLKNNCEDYFTHQRGAGQCNTGDNSDVKDGYAKMNSKNKFLIRSKIFHSHFSVSKLNF